MSDEKLDMILDKLMSMETDMNSVKSVMGSMETDMNSMKSEMGSMKSQLDENTQITKAIYHRQEETDAKLEALSFDVAIRSLRRQPV